ncbi:MAG: biopolymer transporter ExbD [Polyangiales bacterium]
MAGSQTPRGGIIEGINVTPLVDITLVLLIIFIVTAKLVVNPAVPLDLPAASTGEDLQTIFAVSITKDGKVLVDGKELGEDAQLAGKAREALDKDKELRAVIQADGDVSHRRVVWVLDQLKSTGLTRVAFGTVQAEGAPPPAPAKSATEEGASGGAE